ncbi:TauD/TfdA family dioxygenase [Polyangium jinanense]|uniref:TauD/TfdA family dioxygenase n=1 Tax=Polyangium jinanense TaxID=2829994 RepID=A0A9X3X8M3_9BACT|nr:TauD/TfdA family dioxygenase [Polyangium jinanense]MDC3954350.1 TauD/TfdA family dioxygenase [Polyangium jinanense]MDC3984198.1 TauD/TfdA family dioxygenase [Polyangium jinanense]
MLPAPLDLVPGPDTGPSLVAHEGWLRVHFGGGSPAHADFHWFWLRHQCYVDRHPRTGERTLDASEVPLGIRPRSVGLDAQRRRVLVTWDEPSGRQSSYDLEWLRVHAYAPGRVEVAPPPSDLARVTLEAGRFPNVAALVNACLDRLRHEGLCVVQGSSVAWGRSPEDDTEPLIEAFSTAGLAIVGTHFGRVEDLRTDNTTNQNTDQLGYTDAGIELHTDQPFLDVPPRYQLLQCIRTADAGGESFFCDALAAARYVASIDATAFERLTTLPVRFHRKQKSFERIVDSPLLTMKGPSGFLVRYSYFTLAPFQASFAEMEAWYRAYTRFAEIVRDPRHQVRLRLEPGDFVIYDNHRMLHGRTAFSGARWVRGVYFDSK